MRNSPKKEAANSLNSESLQNCQDCYVMKQAAMFPSTMKLVILHSSSPSHPPPHQHPHLTSTPLSSHGTPGGEGVFTCQIERETVLEEKGRRRIRIKKRSLSPPSIEVELLSLPLLLLRPQAPSVSPPPFLAEFNFSKRHARKRRRRKKTEGFVSLPSLSLFLA